MIQTFTSNDLVRHLYTEESLQEGEAFEKVLNLNEQWADCFEGYCSVKSALNKLSYDPSPESMDMIYCYSILSKIAMNTGF